MLLFRQPPLYIAPEELSGIKLSPTERRLGSMLYRRIQPFAILLCLLIQSKPAELPAADKGNQADITDRFDVLGDGDSILVPVELGTKTYQFLVDTGCTRTVIDTAILDSEPIRETKVYTKDEVAPVKLFKVPAVSLRKHNLQAELTCVAGIDLENIRSRSGHDIYGAIGMDFLAGRVVQLNFDERTLFLRERVDNIDPTSGIDVSFNERNLPVLKCGLPSLGQVDFMLDTGFIFHGSGSLEPRTCRYLQQMNSLEAIGAVRSQTFVASSDSRRLFTLKWLELEDHQSTGLMFDECRGGENILGLNYLSRFNVTIDFPNKKLFLSEGKSFHKPDRQDLSGMHVSRRNSKTVVEGVDSGSAAEIAGIHVGDEITAINDRPVASMRLYEVRGLLSESNPKVVVTVCRNSRNSDVAMELK